MWPIPFGNALYCSPSFSAIRKLSVVVVVDNDIILKRTRMHSSRMRTAFRPSCHACPPLHHTCPPFTTHAPPFAAHAPQTEFLTHACENITFPQLLLRAVNKDVLVIQHPRRKAANHQRTSSDSLKCEQTRNPSKRWKK